MKMKEVLDESFKSEVKRKIQGKLSGKEHAKRLGLLALQRLVDGIEEKRLYDMFGSNPSMWDDEVVGYLIDLRKEGIEAIKALKKIEK